MSNANKPGDKFHVYEFRTRRVRRSIARDMGRKYVSSPADVAGVVRHLTKGDARENFFVFMLDVRNQLLGFEVVAIGGLANVEAHPREVFRPAIITAAAAIILAHNHPSGVCTPSSEDIALTNRMAQVGDLIGIPVCDHVVVTEDSHFSLHEANIIIIPKLNGETK